MTPSQSAFLVPISVFCIIFASFYINIRTAKKKVLHWKGYSTWMFLQSPGLAGIRRRAKRVWMEELGYDEAEALTIAEHQSRAFFFAAVGSVSVMVLAATIVKR
jgi:hypothetical protein